MLTCVSDKLMRNKDISWTFAQACVILLLKMQPKFEFTTNRLRNKTPSLNTPSFCGATSLLGVLLFHVMGHKAALRR